MSLRDEMGGADGTDLCWSWRLILEVPGEGMAVPWAGLGELFLAGPPILLTKSLALLPRRAAFGPKGPSFSACMMCVLLGSEAVRDPLLGVLAWLLAGPSAVLRSPQPLRCVSKAELVLERA